MINSKKIKEIMKKNEAIVKNKDTENSNKE